MLQPREELLSLAELSGAVISGKPDGSESIKIIFTIDAWRRFDNALAQQPAAVADKEPKQVPTRRLEQLIGRISSALEHSKTPYLFSDHDGWASVLKEILSLAALPLPRPEAAVPAGRPGEPECPAGPLVSQCESCGGCREWGGRGLWHHAGCNRSPDGSGGVWLEAASPSVPAVAMNIHEISDACTSTDGIVPLYPAPSTDKGLM